MNILVPIDFSKCSKNALRIAIQLAKKSNAKIHMINAVHVHTPHPDFTGGNIIDTIMSDYEAQVQQSFNELKSEIIELKDVPHESDRFTTYLSDAIHSAVKAKEIDIIVMGTRSDHEAIDQIIGTNATDVIQSSDIPVLVIPEDFSEFNPKKIGFATDLIKISYHGKLDKLIWLAKVFDAEMLVFHVTDDPNKLSHKEEKQIHEISTILKDVNCSVRTVEAKTIISGIHDFIANHELDILTMVPRKHNLFERLFRKSITKSIAIKLSIPLFTIHD